MQKLKQEGSAALSLSWGCTSTQGVPLLATLHVA